MTPDERRALRHIDCAAGILRSTGDLKAARDEARYAWIALDNAIRDEAARAMPALVQDRRAA